MTFDTFDPRFVDGTQIDALLSRSHQQWHREGLETYYELGFRWGLFMVSKVSGFG